MKGETVDCDCTSHDGKLFIGNTEISSHTIFAYFKVIDGDLKMSYNDFEYVLCNHVFRMALLSPGEYAGVRHLIIHNPVFGLVDDLIIMITVNKTENTIRVSYPDEQRVFTSYEDAIDYIRNKK
jgi:hypothetical protein